MSGTRDVVDVVVGEDIFRRGRGSGSARPLHTPTESMSLPFASLPLSSPLWRLPGREASHTGETTQPTSSYHPTPKWLSLCRARVLYSNRSLRLYHRRSAASRQKKNTTRYIPHNRIDHRHFLISNLQLQALRVATAAVSATERSSE